MFKFRVRVGIGGMTVVVVVEDNEIGTVEVDEKTGTFTAYLAVGTRMLLIGRFDSLMEAGFVLSLASELFEV